MARFYTKVRTVAMSALVVLAMASCGGKSAEIKIGSVNPLSGEAATYGTSTKNSVELATAEWNAAGGINGKQIKLIVEDDKADPAEGATVFRKLIEQDKVVAIIGGVTSRVALAAAPVANDAKIPLISPTATNEKVTQIGEYVFRSCFIDPFQGKVGAKYVAEDMGLKTAGIIFDIGNDYSKGLMETFKVAFEAAGGTVVEPEGYPSGTTDFKAQLTKIAIAKPEVLYIPAYYSDVGLITKQARELGYAGIFVGVDGWDSSDLVKIGGDSVEGGIFTNHYSKDDSSEIVQSFVKKYTEKYGAAPDALAALAYDGANILYDAIKRAGSTKPEAIRDALKATDLACVGGQIKFDEYRNPVKSAVIIEMKGGEQVYRATANP